MSNNYKSVELSKVYVNPDANYRLPSDYGTPEELAEMGASIIRGGVDKMDAIVVVPFSRKDGIEGFDYEAIAGFSRCLGLMMQPGWEQICIPIRVESAKTSIAERIRINLASNIHRTPNPWSDANALEMLMKLGLKGKKLQDNMPGKSPSEISQLKQLVSCSDEVREAGRKGLIKATLVRDLINKNNQKPIREKNSPDNDENGNPIQYQLEWDKLQSVIAAEIDKKGKVTAIDFSAILKSPVPLTSEQLAEVEKAKQEAVTKALVQEANKRFSSAVKKAESLKVDIKSVPSPSDETNPVFQGKSAVERYDYCTDLVNQAIATKESADKQVAEKAELERVENAKKLVEGSKQAQPSGDSPAQSSPNATPGEVPGNSVVVGNNSPVAPVAPTTPETPTPREGNEREEIKVGNLHARVNIHVNDTLKRVQDLRATKARNETVRLSMILTGLAELEKAIGAFKSKEDLI